MAFNALQVDYRAKKTTLGKGKRRRRLDISIVQFKVLIFNTRGASARIILVGLGKFTVPFPNRFDRSFSITSKKNFFFFIRLKPKEKLSAISGDFFKSGSYICVADT